MIGKLDKIKIEELQFFKIDCFDGSKVKAETSIFGIFDVQVILNSMAKE